MLTRKQQLGRIRPKTFKQHAKLPLRHQYHSKTKGKLPQVDLILRQAQIRVASNTLRPLYIQEENWTAGRVSPESVSMYVVVKRTRRVPRENRSPAVKRVANEFMDRSIPTHLTTNFSVIYIVNKILTEAGVSCVLCNKTRHTARKGTDELYPVV